MHYSIQNLMVEIKAARKKKGFSQRALSIQSGIPQSHISKIEKGLVDLQISSLIELARVLDLELVLVSRNCLSALRALQAVPGKTLQSIPAYQLPGPEEDDDA